MPSRGTKALELFIDALREDYDWLVDDLEEALKNPEEVLEEERDVVDSVNLENVSKGKFFTISHIVCRFFTSMTPSSPIYR